MLNLLSGGLVLNGIPRARLFVYLGMAVFILFFYRYYQKKTAEEENLSIERRKKYVEENPSLPVEVKEAVLSGTLVKDMNEEELYASIGKPKRKKIISVEPVKSEVFIYTGLYVHVYDGKVRNWQEHKKLLGF